MNYNLGCYLNSVSEYRFMRLIFFVYNFGVFLMNSLILIGRFVLKKISLLGFYIYYLNNFL